MADKYVLRVTAGPGYNEGQHVLVTVNNPRPVRIKSEVAHVELSVRIRGFTGPPDESPSSSVYFDQEPHASNEDQYSISFRFTPLRPRSHTGELEGISGQDLLFGNDFDRPIRDRLPPGFNTAMNIVQRWIDPGLSGDAYADQPYLYGAALSSFNCIQVGSSQYDETRGGLWVDEGGDDDGMRYRAELGVPDSSRARMKWALSNDNKRKWVFEYGRTYGFDFFNAYLDFANLALRLPGFHLPVVRHLEGQGPRYGNAIPVRRAIIIFFPAFPFDYTGPRIWLGFRQSNAATRTGP